MQGVRVPFSSERVSSPVLHRLHDYWQALRGEAEDVPPAARLSPLDIPDILPHVFLVDYDRDTDVFHYRLIGTEIAAFTGRDLTGRAIDAATYGAFAEAARDFFRMPVERGRPVGLLGNALWIEQKQWMAVELAIMPLADEAGAVHRLVGGYVRMDAVRSAVPEDLASTTLESLRILTRPFRDVAERRGLSTA